MLRYTLLESREIFLFNQRRKMLPWEINLMPCFSVKINGSQFGKFVIFRGIIHNQAYSEAKKIKKKPTKIHDL